MTAFGTMSLGELIDKLKAAEPGSTAWYDFGHLRPSKIRSYRGYYDHLALGWDNKSDAPKVEDLIRDLEAADGGTYSGWKGGDYTMDLDTPIWADNAGDASSTAIVDVKVDAVSVKIVTKRV